MVAHTHTHTREMPPIALPGAPTRAVPRSDRRRDGEVEDGEVTVVIDTALKR